MALRHEMTLEKLNSRSGDNLPGWFGMKVVEVREGSMTMEYTIRPQYLAPNGFLHAASVIALADTSAGYATIAHLRRGRDQLHDNPIEPDDAPGASIKRRSFSRAPFWS